MIDKQKNMKMEKKMEQ